MRRGTLFWGVVLILVGIVFLLDSFGLLPGINVWDLMWPALLILLGLWILLGRAFHPSLESESLALPLEGTTIANLRLQHAAGRLSLSAGTTPGMLLTGEFRGGVEVDDRTTSDQRNIRLYMPHLAFPFFWNPGESRDWNIQLSPELPLKIKVEGGANEMRFDLTDLIIEEFRVSAGANATEIEAPRHAGYTRMLLESGAASVRIAVPSEVAARIKVEGAISEYKIDTKRFIQQGSGLYQSADYDSAANKLEIKVQMGVGSLRVA